MIDYTQILTINYPNTEWSLNGNSYDDLMWLDSSPKPTQAELDALWPETQTTITNQQVNEKRRVAYMVESDPIIFKVLRDEATMEEWKAKVTEIKIRYPKPE
jgi:hypothetical protein